MAVGSIEEGASTIHSVPLAPNLAKVVIEEVRDAYALVPVPTDEVMTVGQALQTFIAWPRHLIRPILKKVCIYFLLIIICSLVLFFIISQVNVILCRMFRSHPSCLNWFLLPILVKVRK